MDTGQQLVVSYRDHLCEVSFAGCLLQEAMNGSEGEGSGEVKVIRSREEVC